MEPIKGNVDVVISRIEDMKGQITDLKGDIRDIKNTIDNKVITRIEFDNLKSDVKDLQSNQRWVVLAILAQVITAIGYFFTHR